MKKYEKMVRSFIDRDPNFDLALSVAKNNSLGGDIWIVGSFLYKNILKQKYGVDNIVIKDYDFMLENQRSYSDTIVPEGWVNKPTYYGGPRLLGDGIEVDVYPIKEALENFSIKTEGLNFEEMMRFYLRGAIFDIQSLAYNYSEGKLIDEGSIRAIESRKTNITCIDSCVGISKKKGISLDEYLDHKSRSIGVEIVRDNNASY